jgi:hypothetical protein
LPDRLAGFISYSTIDRVQAGAVRDYLTAIGVDCFLAHDDLGVSEEWKRRILEELHWMNVFVALLSASFKSSDWASQELGFAVARPEVPIIPLSLDGTVPFGFISHLQGKRITEPLTDSLFLGPLQRHYPRQLTPALIERMSGARTFRGAEALMEPLRPMYKDFTASEIDQFAEACIRNNQIWDAALCATTYIPEFIQIHRHRMRAARLQVLQFQVEQRMPHEDAHIA